MIFTETAGHLFVVTAGREHYNKSNILSRDRDVRFTRFHTLGRRKGQVIKMGLFKRVGRQSREDNEALQEAETGNMAPLFQLATRVLSEGKEREKAKDYLITAASGRHRPSAGLLFAEFGAADFLLIAPAQMVEAPETVAKLEEASGKEKEKDLDTANRIWLSLAEEGVAEAQYNLGYSLDMGEGLEKTPALALFWYACAASQGHIKAMFRLGRVFDSDRGLNGLIDVSVSAVWYQKAAELGHPRAAAFLGIAFENGEGVEKSLEEALKWYRIAAERGDSVGMYSLAFQYQRGERVARDLSEAARLYRAAAEKGHIKSQYCLGNMLLSGMGVEKDPKEGLKWIRRAAENGDAAAEAALGAELESGDNIDKNIFEAAKWYIAAAEQGEATATRNLGVLCLTGNGVEQDRAKGTELLRLSGEAGAGAFRVGLCYAAGESVEQNYAEAAKWYKKAAEWGDGDGAYELGNCYHCGHGVSLSDAKAFEWYRKGAALGNAEAMYEVGEYLTYGIGVNKDRIRGIEWLHKAGEAGSAMAYATLGSIYSSENSEHDDEKSMECYVLAAERGYNNAIIEVGSLFKRGNLPEKYRQKAIPCLRVWLGTLKRGAYFHFGGFIKEGEKYPLRWIVLDRDGERLFLISEHILLKQCYYCDADENELDATWETSDIRKTLNSDFMEDKQRFSDVEREMIAETTLSNPDNPIFHTPGGRDTVDKVFLLSVEEVLRYFSKGRRKPELVALEEYDDDSIPSYYLMDDENSVCTVEHYLTGERGWSWWLRSPGREADSAAVMRVISYSSGAISLKGDINNEKINGVRPALWIDPTLLK